MSLLVLMGVMGSLGDLGRTKAERALWAAQRGEVSRAKGNNIVATFERG